MRRFTHARRRLTSELKTRGIVSTVKMLARYAMWRLRGSPPSTYPDPPALEDWLDAYGALDPPIVGSLEYSVICPVHDTPPELLRACVRSVLDQSYPNWELVLVDDASTDVRTAETLREVSLTDSRIKLVRLTDNVGIAEATNAGARAATGEYLVFLDHDDLLAPTALAWLSTCTPGPDLVYSDEDKVYADGRHGEAFFKPGWSPRLLLSVNYVNHLTCVRTALFRELGGLNRTRDGVQDHDFLLRLSELPGVRVSHLPNVLYHWRSWSGSVAAAPHSKLEVEATGIQVIEEAIRRRGWNAHAGLGNGRPFNYRVYFDPEPESPLVKIVIPTRDRVSLLRQAVDGVLTRTDGVRTHIVIVDNGSRSPKTLGYLNDLRRDHEQVSVHKVDDAFNFSRLCNEGARIGPDAPMILFLNNDIEIRHRRWLLQLTGWLRDPEVGAVGAKLLFGDGTIQHGGVIVGLGGLAGHYAGDQPNQPQVGNLHDQAREVGCLTAACLLMRTTDYERIGGMSENLPVDFQDVDLCLRIRRDLRTLLVYDPTYPLVHRQSATRGKVDSANGYTVARMLFLWERELMSTDFYYSPHLTLNRHDFSLAAIPGAGESRRSRLQARSAPTRMARPRDQTASDA